MSPSFELSLLLGIIGFYLYDSVLLLYADEVVFIKGDAHWAVRRPSSGWLIAGKAMYLPNPFAPALPIIRSCWGSTVPHPARDGNLGTMAPVFSALRPLQRMTWILFGLFFGVFPPVLFFLGSGAWLLVSFGLVYGLVVIMLVYSYANRGKLGVDRRTYLRLAFDSAACPPFALNLVRKIALHNSPKGDPLAIGKESLRREDYRAFLELLGTVLEDQLAMEESSSARHASLLGYRAKLKEAQRDV